ncbi:MAG: pyridoxamine 5'-phosphate oxidase family protein [Acidimicrobiia bacterium]
MSVRLTPEEAWDVLARAHTGILTTLRRDGMPISLPMWFVAIDRTICISAPSRTKKLSRVRKDPRASFLVESGERWAELEAVHLTGRIETVTDEAEMTRIADALDVKYAAFRTAPTEMSQATRDHYAGRTYLRLVPDERILSWDNRKLGLT